MPTPEEVAKTKELAGKEDTSILPGVVELLCDSHEELRAEVERLREVLKEIREHSRLRSRAFSLACKALEETCLDT